MLPDPKGDPKGIEIHPVQVTADVMGEENKALNRFWW